jgi:hypothetical protein
MINYKLLDGLGTGIKLIPDFKVSRVKMWDELLGISGQTGETVRRAVLGSAGQFNFWERNGKIEWKTGFNSDSWFCFVREYCSEGQQEIKERIKNTLNYYNLPDIRIKLIENTEKFLAESSDLVSCIRDPYWWEALSHVFGGDPLKKRETLLWMILTDLGIDAQEQKKGCIDYNIILLFRFLGIITGFDGNIFTLYDETRLREECLKAVEYILEKRPDLSISELDFHLWSEGRQIRGTRPQEEWDPFFCYRLGCFFY